MTVSWKGNLKIVNLLCQNEAEVNLQEENESTALIFGISFNLYLNYNYIFEYFYYFSFGEWTFKNSETTLSKQC
jgi:hypothetical protein